MKLKVVDGMAVVRIPSGFSCMNLRRVAMEFSAWTARRYIVDFSASEFVLPDE
jgi:hypothetical protein